MDWNRFHGAQLLRSSGDGGGRGHTAGSLFLLSGRMLGAQMFLPLATPKEFLG
jgi:hypothetical protein